MNRRVTTTVGASKSKKPTVATPAATAAQRSTVPVPPVKTEQKPAVPSRIVEASKNAEETLAKLKEQEDLERERIKNKNNVNVLSGEIDWYQYLQPKDTRDIDACIDLDSYNHSVYEHNNAMLPKVNELLRKLGLPPKKLDPPTTYVARARAEYEKMLFDENFRVLHGIKFLAQRSIFPVRDYEIDKSYERADKIAFEEEVQRQIKAAGDVGGVDISSVAGSGHKTNCTCENRWDGTSERCIGEGIRVRWRQAKDHHFLRPRVFPETY